MTQAFAWTPLAPLGAEVHLDLSMPLSAGQEAGLVSLMRERGLILARGQSLSMDRQRTLCALFGPILLREGETGYMTNEGGGPAASGYSFHSDAAYTPDPFDALSLHALDVAAEASSTRFVSAETGLAALPAELRDLLEYCEQEMISPDYTQLSGRSCDQRDPEALRRAVMPAVFTNPHNHRPAAWVSEMQTARLLGMEWQESRDTLHRIYDHLYAPERVFEHRWRNGDLLIWDNIALQHARGNLENVGKRLLQRVIVGVAGVAPHIPLV